MFPAGPTWLDGGVRIATWNVNSVLARLPRLTGWLEQAGPDVVCLQETKVGADAFPADAVAPLGYAVASHGEGRWNGVAVLSRVGLEDVARGLPGDPGVRRRAHARGPHARRHLRAGAGAVGIRAERAHARRPALRLQAALAGRAAGGRRRRRVGRAAVRGDGRLQRRAGRRRCVGPGRVRRLAPTSPRPSGRRWPRCARPGCPTWCRGSPRARTRSRTGTTGPGRSTRAWACGSTWSTPTPPLAGAVTDAWVDREARKGKGPSDHAPVIVDLSL